MTNLYALTDNAILRQIGQKLKEARVDKNISQKALADACGLSAFSISQMENGHNTSLLSLVMVLRALNRFDWLEEILKEKPFSPIAISQYMKKHPKRKHTYKIKADSPQSSFAAEQPVDFNWDKD
ncbi:MAG: helix-turn-helix transcriptional regulator [Bacteroidaceae bacterium]|nr:helix-turn-helix transcriptional regulator [Bacteroidaceae bacterium]